MVDIYIQDTDIEHLLLLEQECKRCLCKNGHHARVVMTDTSLENILMKSRGAKKEALFIMEYQPSEDFKLLALNIRRENPSCYIVLTVHKLKEALDSFPIGIRFSRILQRPVTNNKMNDLLNSMETDYFQLRMKSHDRFQFRIKNCDYYVYFSDILFFECHDKKVILKTAEQKFEFYDTLKRILSFAPKNFIRTHRGFLVNLNKIAGVDYNRKIITMIDGSQVFVSRRYKNTLQERLEQQRTKEKNV